MRPRNVCWWCGGKLVWQADHTVEDWNADYSMYGETLLTQLECCDCKALVEYKKWVKA